MYLGRPPSIFTSLLLIKHKSHDGIFLLYVIPSVSHTLTVTNDNVTDDSTATLVLFVIDL